MSDEDLIRSVLTALTRGLHAKNAAAVIAPLADDEVTFDLAPPLSMGPEITHDLGHLEEWFETWDGPIVSKSRDLKIAVGDDVAYAFGMQHLMGTALLDLRP